MVPDRLVSFLKDHSVVGVTAWQAMAWPFLHLLDRDSPLVHHVASLASEVAHKTAHMSTKWLP